MKSSMFTVAVLASLIAASTAMPRDVQELQQNVQQMSEPLLDGTSQTWDAVRNWFRPATTYISDSLPDMTPSELATDIKETAIDLRDRARDHPVIQGISSAVQPVHRWVSDTASNLSKTSFRDMYDNVAQRVGSADEVVADWINRRSSGHPQSENIEILE